MPAGEKCVKARLAAKGYQDPNLKNGNVDASGRVSFHFFHLQLSTLGAIRKRRIWSLDVKNAFPRADGFVGISLHELPRSGVHRMRNVFGNCIRRPSVWVMRLWHVMGRYESYKVGSVESSAKVGLRFRISSLIRVCNSSFDGGVEQLASSPLILMIFLGAASRTFPPKFEPFRKYRFGTAQAQESSFVHVGAGLPQERDFSVGWTREEIPKNLKPLLAPPELWACSSPAAVSRSHHAALM